MHLFFVFNHPWVSLYIKLRDFTTISLGRFAVLRGPAKEAFIIWLVINTHLPK